MGDNLRPTRWAFARLQLVSGTPVCGVVYACTYSTNDRLRGGCDGTEKRPWKRGGTRSGALRRAMHLPTRLPRCFETKLREGAFCSMEV